ncbi:TerB family tellurite resistance protein [soil metagenome]
MQMMKTLKELLDRWLPPLPGGDPDVEAHALQVAAAVLLVEVMRADAGFLPGERAAVLAALRDKFQLAEDEASQLTALAETAADKATDLFAFTSRINTHFDMPQKLQIIEYMWRVAYADGHLSAHERHVTWRIADLLHVPQGAYVNARMRAQAAAEHR